jgi:hypothetical protein
MLALFTSRGDQLASLIARFPPRTCSNEHLCYFPDKRKGEQHDRDRNQTVSKLLDSKTKSRHALKRDG